MLVFALNILKVKLTCISCCKGTRRTRSAAIAVAAANSCATGGSAAATRAAREAGGGGRAGAARAARLVLARVGGAAKEASTGLAGRGV